MLVWRTASSPSISQGVYRRILGGNASTQREAVNGAEALTSEIDRVTSFKLAFIKECDVIHKPVSPNLPRPDIAARLGNGATAASCASGWRMDVGSRTTFI